MKFIKISLYLVFALLLIVVVAAVFFVVTFDANDYKPQIAEQVKKHTGRELTIGDIKPSVFPWLGIELQQLALSNAEEFNTAPMMQVSRIDVRLEIIPLLKQNINVDTVRVHGLHVNLQKNTLGKTNWDDILEKQDAAAGVSADDNASVVKGDESKDAEESQPLLFKSNGIELSDATLQWDDAQAKQKVTVSDLNISSGVIQFGQPVPLQISALIKTQQPAASVQLNTSVNINFDMKTQQMALDDLALKLNAKLVEFDIDSLALNLNTGVKANLEKQTFSLPKLSLEFDAKGKAIPGGEIKAHVTSGVELNLLTQLLQLKQLKIQALDVVLKSELQVTQLIDSPMLQGRIDVGTFNPQTLLSRLKIELPKMQGVKALQSAALGFELTAGLKAASLNALNIKFDDTTLHGFVSVSEFAQPKIAYKLAMDKINLDAYLPPAEETPVAPASTISTANTAAAAVAVDVPIELPIELLRSLAVDGVLNVDEINGFEQTINQLMIELSAANGLIKVPVLNANLLEGNVALSAQLDVRKDIPQYQLKLKARGINTDTFVNPLLQDVLGESTMGIHGASNLDLSVMTAGQSVKQLIANSNGNATLNADNVVLQGVDAEYFVRKAVTDYLQEKNIPLKEEWKGQYTPKDTTAIKTLHASAVIKQGVIQNNDLLLDSARLKVTGAGNVNLPEELLHYRVVVDVQPLSTKTVAEKFLDIPLALRVTGSFATPVIEIEKSAWTKQASGLLTSKAKAEAKQKIEVIKEEKKVIIEEKKAELEQKKEEKVDELKDKLKDKFKGLFN